jgi:hypothetical protein
MIPKTYIYDAEHKINGVMTPVGGIDGFELHFIGMDIGAKMIQFTSTEGVLKADSTGLEIVSKERAHLKLSEQEAINFYAENKTAIDSLLIAASAKIAESKGKTGTVNE